MNAAALKVNPKAIILVILVIAISATSLIVVHEHSKKEINDKIIENISIDEESYYI